MKFSKLVEHVSKKPIPPHVQALTVEVMVSDEQGEDVEAGLYQLLWRICFDTPPRCHSLL